MIYTVVTLYRNGIPQANGSEGSPVTGDIYLSETGHPVMNRLTTEATLIDPSGRNLLPALLDAKVVRIAAHTMLIRGIEINDQAQQVVQEWSCAQVNPR